MLWAASLPVQGLHRAYFLSPGTQERSSYPSLCTENGLQELNERCFQIIGFSVLQLYSWHLKGIKVSVSWSFLSSEICISFCFLCCVFSQWAQILDVSHMQSHSSLFTPFKLSKIDSRNVYYHIKEYEEIWDF